MSSVRDEWIVNQRLVEKRTYSAIGRDVDLTPQYCAAIVRKHKLKASVKARRDRLTRRRLFHHRRETLRYWRTLLRAIESAEVQR